MGRLLFPKIPFLEIVDFDFKELLWFVCQKLVDGFIATRPGRIVVFIKQHDPSGADAGIEKLQGVFVGLVEVTIEMDEGQSDIPVIRKSVAEITFDQAHAGRKAEPQ